MWKGNIPYVILAMFFFFVSFFPLNSKAEEPCVTLMAVGDIMLSRNIGKAISAKGNDYPFYQVASTLDKGDIVFGNLESILSDRNEAPFFEDKPYNFSAPLIFSNTLKNAGFNVLNLANNHAMDFGPSAVIETRSALYSEGISAVGAGKDMNEASSPSIVTIRGLRFAFFGFGTAHSPLVYADHNRGGIAPIRPDLIKNEIQSVRARADIVVVSLHWGKEYDSYPSKIQKKIAHELVDSGADIILGHHPHVFQGIEIYKKKPIAYSLGNFIFDQKGNGTDESIILVCTFRGKVLSSVRIVPIDRFRSYFPKVSDGKAKLEILQRMKKLSILLNSDMQAFKSIVSLDEI